MKPNRVWIICESRCTGFPRAYKTREDFYAELQHNDNETLVIELSHHDAIVQTFVETLEWYEKASCAERCADGNRANKVLEKFKERTG